VSDNERQPMKSRRVRTYYRSLRGGAVWCESRNSREVVERSDPTDTFQRLDIFEIGTPWHPWDPTDSI